MKKLTKNHFLLLLLALLTEYSCKVLPKPLPLYDIAQVPDKQGWYNLVNGKYQGQLAEGIPNGRGVFIYKNGIKYEGNFSNGDIQGIGVLTIPGYGVVSGTFDTGLITNGEIEYENGNFFKGYFRNGKKYEGVLLEKDYAYVGRFENDLFDGNSMYVDYRNGIVYKGNYSRGQKNGEGFEYNFKNDECLYKKYTNDVDETNKVYQNLSLKEIELEFEQKKKELSENYKITKENLDLELAKQNLIKDTIQNIDRSYLGSISRKCACALEKDKIFIDFCRENNENGYVYSSDCNCNKNNPYQFGFRVIYNANDDEPTEEETKKMWEDWNLKKEEYENKFIEESKKLRPICLSILRDVEGSKKKRLSELEQKHNEFSRNINTLSKELTQRERAISNLQTRQSQEKQATVSAKIKSYEKTYNERAMNEFKSLKSNLRNSQTGCSCGCIVLNATRPDPRGMRGCPR